LRGTLLNDAIEFFGVRSVVVLDDAEVPYLAEQKEEKRLETSPANRGGPWLTRQVEGDPAQSLSAFVGYSDRSLR